MEIRRKRRGLRSGSSESAGVDVQGSGGRGVLRGVGSCFWAPLCPGRVDSVRPGRRRHFPVLYRWLRVGGREGGGEIPKAQPLPGRDQESVGIHDSLSHPTMVCIIMCVHLCVFLVMFGIPKRSLPPQRKNSREKCVPFGLVVGTCIPVQAGEGLL